MWMNLFEDLRRVLMPLSEEIQSLKTNGVRIESGHVTVDVLFVADFKVIYAVTGGYGANGRYPCPWCSTPKALMDLTFDELYAVAQQDNSHKFSLNDLYERPEVQDLKVSGDFKRFQRGGTFNILHLQRRFNPISSATNAIPPALHIRLGIINKIVRTLDGVVAAWNKARSWSKNKRNLQ